MDVQLLSWKVKKEKISGKFKKITLHLGDFYF